MVARVDQDVGGSVQPCGRRMAVENWKPQDLNLDVGAAPDADYTTALLRQVRERGNEKRKRLGGQPGSGR